jgi:hypothetical protein
MEKILDDFSNLRTLRFPTPWRNPESREPASVSSLSPSTWSAAFFRAGHHLWERLAN